MPSAASRREFVDRVVSLSAAIVAVSALAVSIYQAKLARDQQRASVWPRLDLTNNNGPHLYARVIRNVGLGPALVRNMEVTFDGRPLRQWGDLARTILGPDAKRIIEADTTLEFMMSTVHRGSVLLPGASVEQLHLKGGTLPDAVMTAAFSGRLLWKACYCSLYGDCWTVTSISDEPTAVGSCPDKANASREFEN
ncbi:MAG TPA: hypothetical protein VGD56_18705 [Gemmatirosa sp.]